MRTRRELLQHLAGAGGLALFGGRLLAGCDDASSGGDDAGRALDAAGLLDATPDAGGTADAALVDADGRWWLSGNFAPVADEVELLDLEVEGALPPALTGTYLRNGSNPRDADSAHWFLGDGMLHGLRLEGGRARWYRNRYIRTSLFDGTAAGGPVPTIRDNASNVSLVQHAGHVLTLGEVGLPYAVRPTDLSTVGVHDFGGALSTAMTAHPKVDPVTGELVFFGYWFLPPYLTYHVADATGALAYSQVVELPASVMMHDFAITATQVIFLDLPIVFDLGRATQGATFPFRWDEAHGARLGVMPRAGGAVRWVDIDLCYVFHVLNAYDQADGTVVLDVVRHPQLWVDGPEDFVSSPRLWRYTVNPATGAVREGPLGEDPLEFPVGDRRFTGRPHRVGYAIGSVGDDFLGADARHRL
ncbi:MAG: carotenoid oxygenase family protein, partial [Myxococcales bacterium]|nr:carotenoid oxygenase family protein [Myxococcales bacterium]